MSPIAVRLLYITLVLLNLALGAFALQLGAGKVPIPADWQWTVPIIMAVVTGAGMFLPKAGREDISALVGEVGVNRARAVLTDAAHQPPRVGL